MNSKSFQHLLQEKETLYNLFLSIPSAFTAEKMGLTGFDILTLDMQHGLIDFSHAVTMLQSIQATPALPFVRLRWNEPSHIMQMLDAGAVGLICPMIDTKEDVIKFVEACQYPPEGNRSYGPVRAKLYHENDYFSTAFESILPFAMIETQSAVRNLEDIASVPGLKGLLVGPYDLSVSMGLKNIADINDPALSEVMQSVLNICKANDLVSAIFTGKKKDAIQLAEMGFDIVSTGTEADILQLAAENLLWEFKN